EMQEVRFRDVDSPAPQVGGEAVLESLLRFASTTLSQSLVEKGAECRSVPAHGILRMLYRWPQRFGQLCAARNGEQGIGVHLGCGPRPRSSLEQRCLLQQRKEVPRLGCKYALECLPFLARKFELAKRAGQVQQQGRILVVLGERILEALARGASVA